MTDHCHYDRWKIVHRCRVAEHLWNEVIVAHDLRLANDTEAHKAEADACLRDYQEHVKTCTTLEGVKQ